MPRSQGGGTAAARPVDPESGRLVCERSDEVDLLLIPLILVGVFVFPFAMAWLEPKQTHTPTHRGTRDAEWR